MKMKVELGTINPILKRYVSSVSENDNSDLLLERNEV